VSTALASDSEQIGTPPTVLLELLSQLVRDLGLAHEADFVPTAPSSAGGTLHESGAMTLVPVRRLDGVIEGYLRCHTSDPDDVSRIERIADFAGAALGESARFQELARESESVRNVAERLQDSLLPPLPELASTYLAYRYRAATRGTRVGGDFYTVMPLPSGLVLIVVGDVVGKGIEAAIRTSRITQTFRALALQGLALDVLLSQADEQVSFQDPDVLATVWCGLYDPISGEIAFAACGHPPALLLRADGSSIWLESEGLPLGMGDLLDERPKVRSRLLEPRDLLVVYTDGLVEPSGDVVAGQRALLEAFEARRNEPLQGVIDALLDELLMDADHTDDALMLLIRRR